MSIVSPLPFVFVPNTLILSSQVDADLQHIVDQVNANAAPAGSGSGTDFGSSSLGSCSILALSTPVITNTTGGTIVNDTLSEWTGALGRFTPASSGTYQISYNGLFAINATDIATASVFVLQLYKNGIAQNPVVDISYPFSGAGTFNIPGALSAMIVLVAGDHVDVRAELTGSTFSTGTVQYFSLVAVRRVA